MQLLEPGFVAADDPANVVGRVRLAGTDPLIDAAIDEALQVSGLDVVEIDVPGWHDASPCDPHGVVRRGVARPTASWSPTTATSSGRTYKRGSTSAAALTADVVAEARALPHRVAGRARRRLRSGRGARVAGDAPASRLGSTNQSLRPNEAALADQPRRSTRSRPAGADHRRAAGQPAARRPRRHARTCSSRPAPASRPQSRRERYRLATRRRFGSFDVA